MMDIIKRLFTEEEGQGMVEYGLIIALVSVAAIIALGALGTNLSGMFAEVKDSIKAPEKPADGN